MVTIAAYCGDFQFTVLEFVFTITNEVEKKIKNRKLFYEEQITHYVKKKVERFFLGVKMDKHILIVYKYEAYNTIMFRLDNILKEKNILSVIESAR
ncbi:hypothetical protein [Oceanobacillus chungangensis]|uniref:Uncharacterized protein n=1 Tax=Oceanobacillus chungangensis TaxID=1229152 RepID=A0A3D8PYK8_9BACI|nr:hypothetical protein [Oceanobacillus chungangensis]RDW21250.1 hypothetical protein CWR45_03125 [Oceanobacillus chungangensis]